MKNGQSLMFIVMGLFAVIILVFFVTRNEKIVEVYVREGRSGGDIQFVLRRNRNLKATFGVRNEKNRLEFDKNDFFEEILSEKEVIITEEEYKKIVKDIDIIAKEGDQLNQEMFSSVKDWIIPVMVYKGKNYVGEGEYYEGDNEKQCKEASGEIIRIFLKNIYSDNPIM